MAKARINSGHQRHSGAKTATPAKPQKVQLRSGFQAATSGLNTSGSVRPIPHTSGSTATMDYGRKLAVAGVRSTPKRSGKRMY